MTNPEGRENPRTVSGAVHSRRSIRAFTAQTVDEALVRDAIARAARAPSGGNLQPWHVMALTGEPLAELKAIMARRVRELPEGEGRNGEAPHFDIYPSPMVSPYLERRVGFANALYSSMGIAREDQARRRRWHRQNLQFFGAPVGLFFYVDRAHGSAQWADLGMYLMTLMLLLREAGLDSCAQESWARYAPTVDAFLRPDDRLMLFCGMAVGYADMAHPSNRFASQRAASSEFARFLGFSAG